MRVLISGGGTGGHVYPLLVVAEALRQEPDTIEILYIGSAGGMEESIVARTDLPYHAVETGPFRGMSPWAMWRSLSRLYRGYRQSMQLLNEWPADVVLITGGYVSVPVALATWRRHLPLMIYLPDREPGWAVRFLSRFADRIAVSFDEFRHTLPRAQQHKVWVSGYPVRAALLNADREAGLRALGLDPALKSLLVLGGSRGARPLNKAIVALLPDLLSRCQIIHMSGPLDWEWVGEAAANLPPDLRVRYHPYPYLHEELSAAMGAADLAIARAGASTMAEFPAAGLPSILVPYPYAGQHQRLNADFMAERGAAVRMDEEDLDAHLAATLRRLLEDEAALKQMSQAARALSKRDAAARLAAELIRLARGGEGKVP